MGFFYEPGAFTTRNYPHYPQLATMFPFTSMVLFRGRKIDGSVFSFCGNECFQDLCIIGTKKWLKLEVNGLLIANWLLYDGCSTVYLQNYHFIDSIERCIVHFIQVKNTCATVYDANAQ